MRVAVVFLWLLCLGSSLAYVVGRGQRMSTEGGHCCFASEGYVIWNAARAISKGTDPYSDEITGQNNIFYYNSAAQARAYEPQRFAYPLFSAFPFLPFVSLSYRGASHVLIPLFAILAGIWIGWLRAAWDASTLLYTALIFATYPVLYDVLSLQPTLLFLALTIAGVALLRAGHLRTAALFIAFSMSKPQIAGPMLLPVLVAAAASKEYRRFVAWLLLLGGLLSGAALVCQHKWIAEWFDAARDYAQYSPPPLISGWLGAAASIVSVLILVALVAVLWVCRNSDLLFLISLSVIVLYPLLPYRSYNAAVFMIPIVWLADNAAKVKSGGALNELALGFSRVAVVTLWVFTMAGAALLWSRAWKIGFMLPIAALHILFFSLCAVMLLQCASVLRGSDTSGTVATLVTSDRSYSDLPSSTATLSE